MSSSIMVRVLMKVVPQMRPFSYSVVIKQKANQHERSKLRSYFVESYLRYVNNYEQKLEKRFPVAMKIYKMFSYGMKSFFRDVKSFVTIRYSILSSNESDGLKDLTRREIELYDSMPKDMVKIMPVLLLSAIPFSNYVIFPLAFMYPHKLLTSHFWNDQQKEEYIYKTVEKRAEYGREVFRYLKQYQLNGNYANIEHNWGEILVDIKCGLQPSVDKIIACKSLFGASGPYYLRNLHFVHMRYLLHSHGISIGLHPFKRLHQRCSLLREMDKAIVREGGVENMSENEISHACFVRGLQTHSLTENESKELLKNWIALSNSIEEDSVSLLLHGPILLGCNLPSHFVKQKH